MPVPVSRAERASEGGQAPLEDSRSQSPFLRPRSLLGQTLTAAASTAVVAWSVIGITWNEDRTAGQEKALCKAITEGLGKAPGIRPEDVFINLVDVRFRRVRSSDCQAACISSGPLSGEPKWSAYRDADIFVLPSQNENFGNTAAEAIVAGTPVLLTNAVWHRPADCRCCRIGRPL